jgi:chaperonin cofactor prefoldin
MADQELTDRLSALEARVDDLELQVDNLELQLANVPEIVRQTIADDARFRCTPF